MTKTQAFYVCWDAYIDVEVGGTGEGGTVYQVYHETRCKYIAGDVIDDYPLEPWEYIMDYIPQGNDGGYTVRSTSSNQWRLGFPNLSGIYGINSNLDLQKKYELNVVAQGLDAIPAGKKMIDEFRNGNVTVDFIFDGTMSDRANYVLDDMCIKIGISSIDVMTLSEELAHAVQHQKYYGDVMDRRYKNYEFEARIYYDIAAELAGVPVSGYFICQDQSNDFIENYSNWITDIKNQGFFTSLDSVKFRNFCQDWNPPAGLGYGTDFLSGFSPRVLQNFFRRP